MDEWWDEPDYKTCGTFALRGVFIITKLLRRDAGRLREVMVDLYPSDEKDPQDITKFEWQIILGVHGRE